MRSWQVYLGLLLVAAMLTGCGAEETPAPAVLSEETYTSEQLPTDYEDALSVRHQLALGTLNLDGTEQAVTPEQAAELLPLWQGLRGTLGNGAAATAEVNALLRQIEETMTAEQLAAIADMHLTQDDLRVWGQSRGFEPGSGERGGEGMPGRELSPEARATRQAERGGAGGPGGPGGAGGGLNNALLEEVIGYLESITGGGE